MSSTAASMTGGTGGSASASASAATSASGGASTGGSPTVAPALGCDAFDEWTLAYYRFEQIETEPIADELEAHPGSMYNDGSAVASLGPSRCVGSAFQGGMGVAGLVPNDSAFQLEAGSIDLWVRPPSPTMNSQAFLSRDSQGSGPGHLAILYASVDGTQGHLVVRLQRDGQTAARCSESPLTVGLWTHVEINFGPPNLELYIDGALQESSQSADIPNSSVPCDAPMSSGLGPDNVWVIGGATLSRPDNSTTPNSMYYLLGGAVDEIRISSVRRSY